MDTNGTDYFSAMDRQNRDGAATNSLMSQIYGPRSAMVQQWLTEYCKSSVVNGQPPVDGYQMKASGGAAGGTGFSVPYYSITQGDYSKNVLDAWETNYKLHKQEFSFSLS